MRTIAESYNVYKFSELSSEAKEQAIEKWYNEDEQQIQCDMFAEDSKMYLSEIFENVDLCYSLSYCQGDGLSFTFDKLYSNDIIRLLNDFKTMNTDRLYWISEDAKESIQKLLKDFTINEKLINGLDLYLISERYNSHYYHSKTVDITLDTDFMLNFNDKTELYLEKLSFILHNIYFIICSQLESNGYSAIEYRMNEEEFSEFMDNDEYEFYKNGDIYL